MKLLASLTAVALLSCSAAARDAKQNSQEPAKSAQKQEAAADKKPQDANAPKPSPEMKKLARMIGGRWQVEEKYEVTPLMPKGGEGKGTAVIHRGPGGLSLITNYKSSASFEIAGGLAGGESEGTGITSWSPNEKKYKQFWVDSGSPEAELWQGDWEGDSLVFTNMQKNGEEATHWRETFSGFSNDAFTLTFEMGTGDTELKRFMTMKFTRIARQSAGVHRHGMGMHGRPGYDTWGGPRADATVR